MGAEPGRRWAPHPTGWRGRVTTYRPRIIRASGAARHRLPQLAATLRRHTPAAAWRRVRAGEPGRMDLVNLWLVLLLIAITLASGLATVAEYFHLVSRAAARRDFAPPLSSPINPAPAPAGSAPRRRSACRE